MHMLENLLVKIKKRENVSGVRFIKVFIAPVY